MAAVRGTGRRIAFPSVELDSPQGTTIASSLPYASSFLSSRAVIQKGMEVFDPSSELYITDTELPLFSHPLPVHDEIEAALSSMILSASGWRKVFAADGDEESPTREVGAADLVLAAQAALTFSRSLSSGGEKRVMRVAVGCDTRPTGALLADAVMRILSADGIEVDPLFITAAPEIMCYVQRTIEVDGFVYITASHNPIGHNGLKFGYADGSVAGGDTSERLIAAFRQRVRRKNAAEEAEELAGRLDPQRYAELLGKLERCKADAREKYAAFTREVAAGSNRKQDVTRFMDRITAEALSNPVGIVFDFNGSARTLSVDRALMEELGVPVRVMNGRPGEIAHRIVPEGESLQPCTRMLQEARGEDSAFTIGCVPDNDGDRGNLVYYDTADETAKAIPAQQLFALTVLAELAWQSFSSRNENFSFEGVEDRGSASSAAKTAVVVNGPTSMRIEAIARYFGARVFRTEVGEANVVARARELRNQGYTVRILGEGSNGGNITHPAAVRDPLNTIFSVLKLLLLRSGEGFPPLFGRWCTLIGEPQRCRPGFTLTDILDSIPSFQTTSAFEAEARMEIQTTDHALLKQRYEEVFIRHWEEVHSRLARDYGIVSWREINYEGTGEVAGFGPGFRTGSERGGLKIIFSDQAGRDTDFIWMRGSGTEPVFRVLADSVGKDPARERTLLEWHRQMIREADTGP
jgi:phosphomannomutase